MVQKELKGVFGGGLGVRRTVKNKLFIFPKFRLDTITTKITINIGDNFFWCFFFVCAWNNGEWFGMRNKCTETRYCLLVIQKKQQLEAK